MANQPKTETGKKSTPVEFIIRQTNGIMRGRLTLDNSTSEIYRKSSEVDKAIIRENMCQTATDHFKTECRLSEILH
ncbi:MAG: hypothetical protein AB7C90_04360 [Bacteroidales bacterium]